MLENNEQNFALFLEGIRKSKNLSREDFCSGIMSQRHYQRYIKGQIDISNTNLAKFADKLETHILNLQKSFEMLSNSEIKYLNNLSFLLNNFEFDNAYIELKKYKNRIFSLNYYNNLYALYEAKILTNLKRISYEESISTFRKLSNINNLTISKSYTYVEIAAAAYLAKLEARKQKRNTIDSLYELVSNQTTITFLGREEIEWMVTIYSTMATVYGLLDEFDKVIELSDIGIELCHRNQLLNSLPHHFFNKSIAYRLTDRRVDALKYASLALMAAKLEQCDTKFLSFQKSIEKQFDISIDELDCWN